ncbi:MAG TPA: GntR family transcriptional regulator, partial [Gaiellaceae bacterium]|nr:GntR family transcriptional regulator [Gaiellaceae bacterium]
MRYSTKITPALSQLIEQGSGASTIASAIEAEIAGGELTPRTKLPPVRDLAHDLAVSPATVAAAYRTLRQRGLVKANGRRGTVVTNRPTLLSRPGRSLPPNTRDLARGNPDPALLPPLDPALRR